MKNDLLCIGLIGANGRLGKAITALESPGIQIVASYMSENPPNPEANIDLFLDVSSKEALEQNIMTALLVKKPIVVGTTGHADLERLKSASKTIPVFYSANFSLGAALMQPAAKEIARRFHPLSIELIEMHHAEKKDAPSGTALMLAQTIENIQSTPVEIRSIRSGSVVGQHELHFHGAEESLSLVHVAKSRDAFARGAIMVARYLAEQCPGFYTMEDLIR